MILRLQSTVHRISVAYPLIWQFERDHLTTPLQQFTNQSYLAIPIPSRTFL